MLPINFRVWDVVPYMFVKHAGTFQLEFVGIFSQINIHMFINAYKFLKQVKILVMRAALKLSIQLNCTINQKLKGQYMFCMWGPI